MLENDITPERGAHVSPSLRSLADDELMALVAEGDPAAFEELVVRHEANLRRYLTHMVGSADAPDVLQELLITLWRKRKTYRPEGKLVHFLYRAARLSALHHLRWRRVRSAFKLDPVGELIERSTSTPVAGGLDIVLERELGGQLSSSLQSLPLKLREAVVLHYAEGLSYGDMSELCGVAEGTLRARAHRGLAQLRLSRTLSQTREVS